MLGLNFLHKIRCVNSVNFPIQVYYLYIKHSKVLTHNSTCHDRITMSLNPLHSFARYDKPFPTNIAVTLCDNRSISWNFTFVSTMRWCHCFFCVYLPLFTFLSWSFVWIVFSSCILAPSETPRWSTKKRGVKLPASECGGRWLFCGGLWKLSQTNETKSGQPPSTLWRGEDARGPTREN